MGFKEMRLEANASMGVGILILPMRNRFLNRYRRLPESRFLAVLLALLIPAFISGQDQNADEHYELNGECYVDCIRIPIKFDGLNGELMIDSGSSASMVDSMYEDSCGGELQRAVAIDAINIKSSLRLFERFRFAVRNTQMYLSPVGVQSLKRMQETLGGPLVGVAGYEFLEQQELCVGFDTSTSRFYLRGTPIANFDRQFPLEVDGLNKPCIRGAITDKQLNASIYLLDTGSNCALTVSSSEFDLLKKAGRLSHESTPLRASFSSDFSARKAVIDSICVFGTFFSNVPILEEKGDRRRIGLAMLRRFDFCIDPSTQSLNLSSKSNVNSKFFSDLSGISLKQIENRIVVHSVDIERFPSSNVVTSGDIIRTIGNQYVTSLAQTRQLLSTYSATPIRLTIQRKMNLTEVELELVRPEDIGL